MEKQTSTHIQILQQVISYTQDMLTQAKQDNWDATKELQDQRNQLLIQLSLDDIDEQIIADAQALTQELMDLNQQLMFFTQEQRQHNYTSLIQGRKAKKYITTFSR